jgi:hypothetical protein
MPPGAPTRFFHERAWDNAYEVVIQMIWNKLSH